MTPAARIAAAIELLSEMLAFDRPADQVTADYLRGRRYVGAKDRRAILERVYGCLRAHARLGWWLARAGGHTETLPPEARLRVLAHEFLRGEALDGLSALCDGERFNPAPLGENEFRTLTAIAEDAAARAPGTDPFAHPGQPTAVRLELPEWLLPEFEAAFGDDLAREAAALLDEAPVDLRVNTLKSTREDARRALGAAGIESAPTPFSPIGLRVEARAPVAATRPFRDGLVEVQDEASQVAALLCGATPGMRVADFCAGAGGKTLALAAAMENKGRLVAMDVLKGRLDRAGVRLKRAGVDNVERRLIKSHRDKWIKRQKGSFERVLVDAPCTGTGAWRRNPDARWRLVPGDLEALARLQAEILESAARLPAPGARLVYATCSLLPSENESRVEAFLAAHEDYTRVPLAEVWRQTIGGGCPVEGDVLKLTPARHGTDGFFVAVLERRAH